MFKRSCTLGALALVTAMSSSADTAVGDPFFGTVSLDGTSGNDPEAINVVAGGDDRADLVHDGCVGFIQKATPDVDLQYSNAADKLFVYVDAPDDTTLIVRTPDGSWVCDDDSMGFNPMVALEDAQTGVYHIWVGTFARQPAPARIHVSGADPRSAFHRRAADTASR